jgi:predicted transposase YdaD
MQQSVIYQEIEQGGIVKGKAEGKLEEGQSLILRLLTRRIGDVAPEMRSASATKVVRKSNPSPFPNSKPWVKPY